MQNNKYPVGNDQKRSSTVVAGFPVKATALFVALTTTGVSVTVAAGTFANGLQQMALGELGSAVFAGGLAFFLIEIFRWARENNSSQRQ